MIYEIKIGKDVYKFLAKTQKHIVQMFFEKIEILSKDPYSPLLDTKALT